VFRAVRGFALREALSLSPTVSVVLPTLFRAAAVGSRTRLAPCCTDDNLLISNVFERNPVAGARLAMWELAGLFSAFI
jgi:hypothetical protein